MTNSKKRGKVRSQGGKGAQGTSRAEPRSGQSKGAGSQARGSPRGQDEGSSQGDEHEEVWTSPQRHHELEVGDEAGDRETQGSPGSSTSGSGSRSRASTRSGASRSSTGRGSSRRR